MSMNKARELLDWLDRASVSIYAAVEETAARDITEQFKIIAQTIRDLIAENEGLKEEIMMLKHSEIVDHSFRK